MINPRLKSYLDEHHVQYRTLKHMPAYTAQETAQMAHIPGKEVAKCVMVKVDGKLAMVVEPANIKLDLAWLQHWLGAKQVELASEYEFKDCFPDCEVGAMPPFGNLYGLDVIVENTLADDKTIAFNAGSHTELVEMEYKDFARLVHPKMMRIAA